MPAPSTQPYADGTQARFLRFGNRFTHGSALILTLVAIAITSLIGAAIATLVAAHNSRTRSDQDAARSLDVAEAAANFQMQRIWTAIGNRVIPFDGNNRDRATFGLRAAALPVEAMTYNGTPSTLNDFLGLTDADTCRCWIEYPADPSLNLDLSRSDPVFIYGSGTVNGITRTVRALAGSYGLFQRWALFTNGRLSFNGTLSVTPLSGPVVGVLASNAGISIGTTNGFIGQQVIYGNATPDYDYPFAYGGRKIELPTIDELATNAYLVTGIPGAILMGINQFSIVNDNALGTATNGNDSIPLPTNGILGGSATFPVKLVSKTTGAANYYLAGLSGSNVTIVADVSNGPINLWINSGGNSDTITSFCKIIAYSQRGSDGNPLPTPADARKFHIYYSNPDGALILQSDATINAQVYAFNVVNGQPVGTVTINGAATITGALICQTMNGNGQLTVTYPTPPPSLSDGAGAMFALQSPWQEVKPVRGN